MNQCVSLMHTECFEVHTTSFNYKFKFCVINVDSVLNIDNLQNITYIKLK